MAIIDDLIKRWKTPTKEELTDLTQPAPPPPTFSPAERILPSQWDNTASIGKRVDGSPLVNGQQLRRAWENTVAKNRDGTPSPYIDTTTGYGVNADGTSLRPVFNVTPQQAEEIREAADRGESFVSIYNRVLKRPEDIDPKMIENRRKLATLADVGAILADVLGVAIGGNSAARKPAGAVNNAFLQDLLDKREQLQMLYDRGLLEAAFRDKAADDAAEAAAAGQAYEQAIAIWKRQNEIDDRQADMDFKAGENDKDRALKEKLNRENNATRQGIASMKNKGDDKYKKGSDIPLSDGKRIKISESELPFSAGSLFQAARQAVIDAGLGDETIATKNVYGRESSTTVSEQLLRIDDMLRKNPNSAKIAIQEIGALIRKYPHIEQKVLEAAENIGLYIEGIEQPNAQDDDFSENIID